MSKFAEHTIDECNQLLDSRLAELKSSCEWLTHQVWGANYNEAMKSFDTVKEILEEAQELYSTIEDKELERAAEELEKDYNKKGEA